MLWIISPFRNNFSSRTKPWPISQKALAGDDRLEVSGGRPDRKLESLLFVGHSFQRHIEHLMQLEEQEGYMSVVLLSHPS